MDRFKKSGQILKVILHKVGKFEAIVFELQWHQVFLGLYGTAVFFVVLFPFQQLNTEEWNLAYPQRELPLVEIHWFQYLAMLLILITLTFEPNILKRFHSAYARTFGSAAFFWFISISFYLLGSLVTSMPPLDYWWKNGSAVALLFLEGGLIGLISGIYSIRPLSASLDKASTDSLEKLRFRWELMKESAERWWKALLLTMPIFTVFMVVVVITWITLPVTNEVLKVGNEEEVLLYRTGQIVLAEITALIGVLAIVINIIGKVNYIHKSLESEYINIVTKASK